MGKYPYVKMSTFPNCEVCGKMIDVRKVDSDWKCDICGKRFCKIINCGFDLSGEQNVLVIPDDIELHNADIICRECGERLGISVLD